MPGIEFVGPALRATGSSTKATGSSTSVKSLMNGIVVNACRFIIPIALGCFILK